jgi:hypothetical protein
MKVHIVPGIKILWSDSWGNSYRANLVCELRVPGNVWYVIEHLGKPRILAIEEITEIEA